MVIENVSPHMIAKAFGISDIDVFEVGFKYKGYNVRVCGDNETPMKAIVTDDFETYFNGEANKINFRSIHDVVAKLKRLIDGIENNVQ